MSEILLKRWIKPPEVFNDTYRFLRSACFLDVREYVERYFRGCKSYETSGYYSAFSLVAFIIKRRIQLAQLLTCSRWFAYFYGITVFDLANSLTSLQPWIQENGKWEKSQEYCDANLISA